MRLSPTPTHTPSRRDVAPYNGLLDFTRSGVALAVLTLVTASTGCYSSASARGGNAEATVGPNGNAYVSCEGNAQASATYVGRDGKIHTIQCPAPQQQYGPQYPQR